MLFFLSLLLIKSLYHCVSLKTFFFQYIVILFIVLYLSFLYPFLSHRTFLGLKADFGYDYLCKIIEKVDSCLAEFKLPLYYEVRLFLIIILLILVFFSLHSFLYRNIVCIKKSGYQFIFLDFSKICFELNFLNLPNLSYLPNYLS